MPMEKELIIHLDNRPGMLAKLGNTLREKNVNIIAILAAAGRGRKPIHLMVDDVRGAYDALTGADFEVEERTVVTIELDNRPGTLGMEMDKIALRGINIDYCYYSVTGGDAAFVVLGVADPQRVESLLK